MIKSKFRITIPLCGLLLLSSCRTEELLHEVEQKEELSKKFITFTKKHDNDVIDYGEGFRSLALRYDSIHKTNMTGRADIAKLEEELQTNNKKSFSKSNEVAYIDFNVRSQLIEEENGDKWMVFPRVKGKEVVDLVMAILSEEETLLSYYRISEESELYKENVNKFEEVYEKKQQKNWNVKNYSYVPYFWEREIEEVIIINPRPLPRKPDLPNTGSPAPPSGIGIGVGFDGNCGAFASCGGGGSGTSTPPPPPSNNNHSNNPCEKIKSQTDDKTYTEKKKFLEGKLNNTSESGFRVGLPISGSGQVGTQYQELSNKLGTSELEFKIFKTTFGIMHTHYDGLYPMFSPGDIYLFGQLLTNAQNNNIPLSDVFLSVVTPAGNYQLRFEGTHFVGWNQNFNIDQLNKDYVREYLGDYDKGTQEKFEKEFLRFMKDKMNIEGAKLIKEGDSGNNTQLSLDHRGNLKTDDCK